MNKTESRVDERLTGAGIILPMPPAWESLSGSDNISALKEWGWKNEKLAQGLFGNGKIDSQTKEEGTFLSEFDNGTSFTEFGQYLFAPILGYYGAQIGENMYDTDLIAATAKRAGAERILNTPDRLLSTYMLMKLLGEEKTGSMNPEDFEKIIKDYKSEIVKNTLRELDKYYIKKEDAEKILEYAALQRVANVYKKNLEQLGKTKGYGIGYGILSRLYSI